MTKPTFNVTNSLVLIATPLVALIAVPWYGFTVGFDGFEWTMFFLYLMFTGTGITAGYHRLWSHRAFEAHWLLRAWLAFWGAVSVQNTILHWCSDHRNHHKHVDDYDLDPYSASRGFWFSHIGWILFNYQSGDDDFSNVKDLQKDPIVRFQHRYYLALTVLGNVGLPLILGFFHGKLWGTFLLAGMLRLVLNHHFTFFINSLAHIWGSRPYELGNSARDNGLLALVTYGEGYHNYHHRFQYDYRNGVRWWQFDPTKWMVRLCAWMGLAKGLKIVRREQIEKARLAVQLKRAIARLETLENSEDFRDKLELQYQQFLAALNDWSKFRQEWIQAKKDKLSEQVMDMRLQYLELKYALRLQRKRWRILTEQLV